MKTLKINEKEAIKLYKTASIEFKQILEDTFGKEYFNRDITKEVNDIDSLCEYLDINKEDLFIYSENTKDKHERFINACNILPKVTKIYNEGVELDWNDSNIYKYLPYLYFSSGSGAVYFDFWRYALYFPSGFYYKSDSLSRKSYSNFQKYWEDYWEYNK